jgi:hypothetical protein
VEFRLCTPLLPAGLLMAHVALAAEPDRPWVFNAPRAEGYTIDLTSIEPSPGAPLTRGETVTFKATVSYDLQIAPKGTVILVFQDEKNNSLTGDLPQVMQEVEKGNGTVTLEQSFVIPRRGKEIRLFVPLMPDGIETTTGEVTIRWPIVKPTS